MKEDIVKNKHECCGCGLCADICPKMAITMIPDKLGFLYPRINQSVCIDCGLCKRMCNYRKPSLFPIISSYAAVNRNREQLMKSASGGLFSAFATAFLKDGGCVCGAQLYFEDGHVKVTHTLIKKIEDLDQILGSKYVQSSTQGIFKKIISVLNSGTKVLFSGTPCQVSAIHKCVKPQFKDNLITIDIICHGVPNLRFFDDYIQFEAKKRKLNVIDYVFRNKIYGWGLDGTIKGKRDDNAIVVEKINPDSSSYYGLFLEGEIYRDCCYSCPYAKDERIGDLTIGDYWGIETYNSELLKENGGIFSAVDGVSCLLVNTEKGKMFLDRYDNIINKAAVPLENIKVVNTQLKRPAIHSNIRDKLFAAYESGGYYKVDQIFAIKQSKIKIKSKAKKFIKIIVPKPILSATQNMMNYIRDNKE